MPYNLLLCKLTQEYHIKKLIQKGSLSAKTNICEYWHTMVLSPHLCIHCYVMKHCKWIIVSCSWNFYINLLPPSQKNPKQTTLVCKSSVEKVDLWADIVACFPYLHLYLNPVLTWLSFLGTMQCLDSKKPSCRFCCGLVIIVPTNCLLCLCRLKDFGAMLYLQWSLQYNWLNILFL